METFLSFVSTENLHVKRSLGAILEPHDELCPVLALLEGLGEAGDLRGVSGQSGHLSDGLCE